MLVDRVWGADAPIDARTVDASVKRLREAMRLLQSSWMLETVRGAGYRLTSGLTGSARGALANAA
jgi:two-component system phosphate regulon response regulator PhoB